MNEKERKINEDTPIELDEDTIGKKVDIDMGDQLLKSNFEKSELVNDKKEKVVKKAVPVDINDIKIIQKDDFQKEKDLKVALFGNKSAYQIISAQSGYTAQMLPLVHKDIVNLLNDNLGRYEYRKGVYQVVWEKILTTSVGRLSFEDWLKITSVEDLETFYYGIYCATFPNEGTFSFVCPKCGESSDYKINQNNLIRTTDKDKMKKLIDKVSKESVDLDSMKKISLIGKNESFKLTDSKIIVELRTPTLWDSLEILRTVPEKTIDRDTISITNMLYINRILIPSKEEEAEYIEEKSKAPILRTIDNLSVDDANELLNAVSDRVDDSRITYSIKEATCPKCGNIVKDIPLSLENILFTLIYEKTQQY